MSDLRTSIQKLAGTFGLDLVQKLTCTVDSVSLDDRSCMVTPVNSTVESFKAQLMAETDDGILILPAKESTVKVLYSRLNAPTVIQFSEVDQVFIVAGDSTFKIYSSGLELDGVNFGGVMKVTPSVKAWNDLQNDVNNLKSLFNTLATTPVVIPTPGSPDAFQALFIATMTAYIAQTLTVSSKSDIENTKVQHGDGS